MAHVEYEKTGAVALVTINRPDRLNALSRDVMIGLAEAFGEVAADPEVAVAVLAGTGRAFCVGLDLKEHSESGAEKLSFPDTGELVNPFFPTRSDDFNKPVVVAVNGLAYGGGYFLFANGDMAVAAESATFEISEVKLGVVAGWEQRLVHGLSRSAAMELALGGRMTAQRAYDAGLVNEVVPDDEVVDRALERARAIAQLPPMSVQFNRELVARLTAAVPDEVTERAERHSAVAHESEDASEALAAFLEKRAPSYKGR